MKVDSIIFDLDGTLWDSSRQVAESWIVVFKKYKVKRSLTTEDIAGVMGLLMEDIIKKLLPDYEIEESRKISQDCCEYQNEYLSEVGAILYPNLEETLKELQKSYKLCIVSNCQAGYIESFFKAHNMEKYFMDYENPGRTGLDKAGNIKLVVERNGFKNPVYVGDTAGDQKSAEQASVPFIFAEYGFGQVEKYDEKITTFDQLPGLLQR